MGCWDRYGIWGFPKAFLKWDYPNSWMVYTGKSQSNSWMNRGVPRYPYDLGNLPYGKMLFALEKAVSLVSDSDFENQ